MSEIKNMDFKYLMQNQQNINSSLSIQEQEKKQVIEYDSKIDYYEDFNAYDDESRGFYLYNMVKYNGRPFYSLVLDAYDSGIISSLEFSKYTNLGQKQIPKLQDILFGGEQ